MSGLGAIIAAIIQSRMNQGNQELEDAKLGLLKSQKAKADYETEMLAGAAKQKKAHQRLIDFAIESMMPTGVEPAKGMPQEYKGLGGEPQFSRPGFVPPGTPADAGPTAGLVRTPVKLGTKDLLTMMALRSGDPKLIAPILQKQTQPNWDEILFGGGNKAPIGATGLAQNLIKKIGEGDPNAIATAERIKLGGGPDLLAAGKQATPSHKARTLYDPDTGQEYTANWNDRVGGYEMTPTGKIKKFGIEKPTQYEDVDIIDEKGMKKRYWYRKDQPPIMGLPIEPPATQMITVEKPGSGKQSVRVGKYGKPGETITTAPEKGMTPDQAGRLQLAQMGFNSVNRVVELLINPDGTVNRANVAKFASPLRIGLGRDIYSNMKAAIESPIRAATGAVINVEELSNYMDMYGPSILDSDELIIDKLKRLYRFNTGYAAKIDPTGELLKRVGPELKLSTQIKPKLKKEKKSNFEIIEVK